MILALSLLDAAIGHPNIELRIARASERIAADPDDPGLYLKRGELHREHRDWEAALADYAAAAELEPKLAAVNLVRGMMFFDAERHLEAEADLDLFLRSEPNSAKGRIARARVRVELGDGVDAADDYDVAIAGLGRITPELYLARARALRQEGDAHLERALRGLDDGMERLGPIVTLQSYAIEIEAARGRYDDALRRLNEMSKWLPPERLSYRTAAILETAGRRSEAVIAYRKAGAAIDSHASQRRRSQSLATLRAKITAALERLDPAPSIPEPQ